MTFDTNTILGVSAIIVAIAIPACGYLLKKSKEKKEKRAKFFKIDGKKSSDLTAFDLLGIRSSEKLRFNEYYLSRDHDNVLAQRLADDNNAIIIGPPLAGKTRAIYQALKKLSPARDIYAPNRDALKAGPIQLPRQLSLLKNSIVFFDDINKHASQPGFQTMLAEYDKHEVQIIATCRDGNNYKTFCDLLTTEQILFGDPIEIARATDKQIEEVVKDSGIDSPNKSDGTIGSIFVPLDEMIKRFNKASEDEKDILNALKRLFDGNIFASGEIFSAEHIKAVCHTEWEETKTKTEWKRLLEKLAQIGFFEINGGTIQIEEVYLEDVILRKYQKHNDLDKLFGIFSGDFDALFALGSRAGDIGENSQNKREYINLAINIYNSCLGLKKNQKKSFDYSGIQNNLGNAYLTLAHVEEKVVNCNLAITAYEKALKVRTLNDLPLDYAATQNNLGSAYRTLADVEDTDTNCELAITAFKESLKVYTHNDLPFEYSIAQNNLGNAYQSLATVVDKGINCRLAISAHEEALKVRTINILPLYYASTQNNLGIAYSMLAEVENRADNCRLAITAYKEALKVRTLDDLPLDYATTQNNLGNAYDILAGVENRAGNCQFAITAYNEALRIRKIDNLPLYYADTHINLGNAYGIWAEVEDKGENCNKARHAYNEALKIYTEENYPLQFEILTGNISILDRIEAS